MYGVDSSTKWAAEHEIFKDNIFTCSLRVNVQSRQDLYDKCLQVSKNLNLGESFYHYVRFSIGGDCGDFVIIFKNGVMFETSTYTYSFLTVTTTDLALLNKIKGSFDLLESKKEGRWIIQNEKGELETFDLKLKPSKNLTEFHLPWIGEDIELFCNRYAKSSSSILVLCGPPGTGKSSLINYFIQKEDLQSVTTYDANVMLKDKFYWDFLSSDRNCLILEDADHIVQKSEGRNEVISKILNVGDGIFDNIDKKIIITCNIDMNMIEPALLRKGRCFGVYHASELTAEQANRLAKYEGFDGNYSNSISLTEFYNGSNQVKKQTFGFGF